MYIMEQVVTTIDELNQYLNGNVTTDSVIETLEQLTDQLKQKYIDELTERAVASFGTSA